MRWLSTILVLCLLMVSFVVDARVTAGGAPAVAPSAVAPPLQLNWFVPSARVNGDVLSLADIGGYELRYRIKGANKFKSVVIRGASNKSHLMTGLSSGVYEFQIATFDADGLYSLFVPINYKQVR